MSTLFDVVLHPIEQQGVDFWWLDWQQWVFDKDIEKLNNTWWLNYTFFEDMERNTDKRPLIYHRWGGLGNHRYQIGFREMLILRGIRSNISPILPIRLRMFFMDIGVTI